jgi:hypothetical protein
MGRAGQGCGADAWLPIGFGCGGTAPDEGSGKIGGRFEVAYGKVAWEEVLKVRREWRAIRTGVRVGWKEYVIKARFTEFSGNNFTRHARRGGAFQLKSSMSGFRTHPQAASIEPTLRLAIQGRTVPSAKERKYETTSRGCDVLCCRGTYDVVFTRHRTTKDCKGMPGRVESQ